MTMPTRALEVKCTYVKVLANTVVLSCCMTWCKMCHIMRLCVLLSMLLAMRLSMRLLVLWMLLMLSCVRFLLHILFHRQSSGRNSTLLYVQRRCDVCDVCDDLLMWCHVTSCYYDEWLCCVRHTARQLDVTHSVTLSPCKFTIFDDDMMLSATW